jgi:hypothetical protein
MTITPGHAVTLLENSKGNRNVSQNKVDEYALDMTEGRWHYNPIGSAIAIDTDGNVINGQHRLWACVQSGIPLDCDVVFGADPALMDVTDIGMPRSSANILQIAGAASGGKCAAAAALVLIHERYGIEHMNSAAAPTKPMIVNRVLNDPLILASVRACDYSGTGKIVNNRVGIFCHYVFAKQNIVLANRFFKELASGVGLAENSPAYRLREALVGNVTSKAKAPIIHVIALVMSCSVLILR